jgi:uncharacterized protein (DUF983 family)
MSKNSGLEALLSQKCPRCRKGDIFQYPAYHYTKFMKMHTHCAVCGLRYEIEPGFFFISMYVSYAITVGVSLFIGAILLFAVDDASLWMYIFIPPSVLLILLPFTFRISRLLMIYVFSGHKFDHSKSE